MSSAELTSFLSPAHFPRETSVGKRVIVIDILRASSTICSALYHGMQSVITLEKIEDTKSFAGGEYIRAAERQGKTAKGFEYGNSPLSYQDKNMNNKILVLSTTNGTRAVLAAQQASEILCGAFVNFNLLSQYIIRQPMDSILLCAGWRNQPSFEDTLFAGALVQKLKSIYTIKNDASLMAETIFNKYSNHLLDAFKMSDHYRRLSGLGNEADARYCATIDVAPVIPFWQKDRFTKLN